MKTEFNQIKPFLRFVRFLNIDSNANYSSVIPYDARLFFVIDGYGEIQANNKKYSMKKNSLIIINSNVKYRHITPENFISYLAVNFDFTYRYSYLKAPIPPDTIEKFDKFKILEHVTFTDTEELDNVLYIESIPSIKSVLTSMESEYKRKINMYELKLSSYMTDIMITCLRHITTYNSQSNENSVANEIINYIQKNFNRNLSNNEIAEQFHYHPNYINKIIKQHTGFSLHQYTKNIRTTKAADMLSSNKSILDVAVSCGFYDTSHFIRNFKEIMGMTPQQYKDNNQ